MSGPAGGPSNALAGSPVTSGPLAVVITGEDWLDRICPFLRARDGAWRSASPVREHRCWAADPPSELPVLTQQRLCLMRGHDGCERFLHARELRSAALSRERPGGGSRHDPAGSRGRSSGGGGSRSGGVVAAIFSLIVAVPRLALASFGVALAAIVFLVVVGGGTPEPVPTGSAPVSMAPVMTASPASVDASPGADGLRRYRVRPGDTLRTIADRFGISVRQLRAVNELGDPPRLEPGDVVLVPPGG